MNSKPSSNRFSRLTKAWKTNRRLAQAGGTGRWSLKSRTQKFGQRLFQNKKTSRRLLILLIAFLLLTAAAGGFFIVRKQQMHQRVLSYRPQGLAALEAGDYSNAAGKLGAYLNHHQDDVEALYKFSQARQHTPMPEGQHLIAAIGALRRVIDLQPDHMPAHLDLLDLYTQVGFASESVEIADAILLHNPKDRDTLHTKALALAQLKRFEDAQAANQAAIALEPLRLESHILALRLLRQLHQTARPIIDHARSLREQHLDDPRFSLLLAIAHRMTGDDAAAAEPLHAAAQNLIPDPDFINLLVEQLDSLGQYAQATDALQRAAQQHPNPHTRRLYIARLAQTGQTQLLRDNLTTLDPADPGSDSRLLVTKALALSGSPQADQARAIAQTLAKRDEDPVARAAPLLQKVLLQPQPNTPDPDLTLELGQQALQHVPDDPYIHLLLGDAHALRNEDQPALESWRQAVRFAPAWSLPLTRIAAAHHEAGQPRQAVLAAQAALTRAPSSVDAAVVLALALAAIDDPPVNDAPLLELVTQIHTHAPREPRTLPLYIDLLARTGQTDPALAALQAALAADPPHTEQTLLRLAQISHDRSLGLTDDLLLRSRQTHGLTPALAYFQATLLHQKGDPAAGLALFDSAHKQARNSGGDADSRWRILRAQFLQRIGDPRAKDAWIALADSLPENLAVQRAALEAPSVQDQRAFLHRVIDRLRDAAGEDSILWRLARARWLLAETDSPQNIRTSAAEAALLLNDAIRIAPEHFEARLLLATCLQRLDNTAGAIEHLQAALNLRPRSASTALHLASLLQSQGSFSAARQPLDLALQNPSLTPAQRRQATLLLAARGEDDHAIQLLSTTSGGTSGGASGGASGGSGETSGGAAAPPDLLLAQLYLRRNQPEKARQILDQLLHSPDAAPSASVLRFAAGFFASQNQPDLAQQALDRLSQSEDLLPGAYPFILAQYHTQYGTPDQAAQYFRDATQAAPTNAGFWRYRIAFLLQRGQTDDALAAADQALEHIPGDPALTTLQQNATLIRSAADAPRLRPLLTAILTSSDPAHTQAALDALRLLTQAQQNATPAPQVASQLQRLADRNPRFLPLQTLTATIFALTGREDAAARLSTRAAQSFPNAAQPSALSAASLAAAQQWDQALIAAREWRSRSLANPLPADLLIAEAHLQLDQPNMALRQLQPHLSAAQADPDNHPQLLTRYARALLAAGRPDEAAALLKPLLPTSASWRSIWNQLAASTVPAAPLAADWLNHLQTVTPETAIDEHLRLANAWASLARRFDIPEYQQAAHDLTLRLAARPDATAPVHFARGSIAEAAGDLPTAEKHYRLAIKLSPDHNLAKNNLAMVLANRGTAPQEAVDLAQQAVAAFPNQPNMLDTLAYTQLKAGKHDLAIQNLQKALELQPDNPLFQLNHAFALAQAGRLGEAADQYHSARPNLPETTTLPAPLQDRIAHLESLLPSRPQPTP